MRQTLCSACLSVQCLSVPIYYAMHEVLACSLTLFLQACEEPSMSVNEETPGLCRTCCSALLMCISSIRKPNQKDNCRPCSEKSQILLSRTSLQIKSGSMVAYNSRLCLKLQSKAGMTVQTSKM